MRGSSPRTRGTQGIALLDGGIGRFIPAHAGNTGAQLVPNLPSPVHPRARGEHRSGRTGYLCRRGSSPRTRGTRYGRRCRSIGRRFIPAHAGNTSAVSWASVATAVHPRARGEHPDGAVLATVDRGSSPRTRGTPVIGGDAHHPQRFIPAHAGNTTAAHRTCCTASVHPRARGEHRGRSTSRAALAGSSPRTRGTRGDARGFSSLQRFIPAHAGNTRHPPPPGAVSPVHPRARGEHKEAFGAGAADDGSSPRTRGTPGSAAGRAGLCRFIPAHAGNTFAASAAARDAAVHPRARGEHAGNVMFSAGSAGSSPRTRGTRPDERHGGWFGRFIPAHAGNTDHHRTHRLRHPVHPRARGEHEDADAFGGGHGGSSPRTRGTRPTPAAVVLAERFIPAHAGNTGFCCEAATRGSVHPRARGEHAVVFQWDPANDGSSPRTRGTPVTTVTTYSRSRFIPAHAGNTAHRATSERRSAVHPRARGEHSFSPQRSPSSSGSSPRTRGTRATIPPSAAAPLPSPVHPRARGEHSPARAWYRCIAGSSPRTRGTHSRLQIIAARHRFIPAHAGNTWQTSGARRRAPVHPRARGEHRNAVSRARRSSGSSPRTRGTPRRVLSRYCTRRFIPAHAGNTRWRTSKRPTAPVHPRARGEHGMTCCPNCHHIGSSPRTRGTP